MLSGGELKKRYTKDFAVFEAEAPSNYLPTDELRKLSDGRAAYYTGLNAAANGDRMAVRRVYEEHLSALDALDLDL